MKDMRPPISTNRTLPDLIDRVLDRGVAIHADVIISLAGIPLVGINLRALVAGMETMTEYGVMHEWDREIRAKGTVPELVEQASCLSQAGSLCPQVE